MGIRNCRIGVRLGVGFGLILIILAMMVVTGNMLTRANKQQLIDGLDLANDKLALAATMKGALLEAGIAMRNIGLQNEVAAMQQEEQRVAEHTMRYGAARDQLLKLGMGENEKKIVAAIADAEQASVQPFKDAIAHALAFNGEGATRLIVEKIAPLNKTMVTEMDRLVGLQQQAVARVLEDSVHADQRLMLLLYGLGGLALACGAVLAWFITRSITAPLNDAVAVAERVAAGDLATRVAQHGHDEIAKLFAALGRMNDSLNQIVRNVRTGTESIGVASRQIAAGNADLSARTELQAGSLEETVSSMEQLTSTVRQNADNARQANQLVVSASDVAVRGGEVVGQVVHTMSSIRDSSYKVVDIISVIDGIAFQTNILALNAAVEAARAGEQGRGFAVVASEVRNLAQRSAAAAREIKALIRDSVDKVDAGTGLVDEAGKTMGEIVDSVRKVADIMNEISAASQEQSAGIEEVNQAIGKMDEMTQQNAALVEQAAAAADSMRRQAAQLDTAVAVFRLAGEAGDSAGKALAPVQVSSAPPALTRAARMGKPVSGPDSRRMTGVAVARTGQPLRDSRDWEEF